METAKMIKRALTIGRKRKVFRMHVSRLKMDELFRLLGEVDCYESRFDVNIYELRNAVPNLRYRYFAAAFLFRNKSI